MSDTETGTARERRAGSGGVVPTKSPTAGSRDVLDGLIARLEAAGGPDTMLDIDIFVGLRLYSEAGYARFGRHFPVGYYVAHGGLAPAYTASVDAALALIERVLPDADFDIQQRCRRPKRYGVLWFDPARNVWLVHGAATPALALCIAFLKALAVKEAES